MIGVVVLGSTGSIGESTLDVLARHPERFRLVGLGAHTNVEKLAAQILSHRPAYAALADPAAARALKERLGDRAPGTRLLSGPESLEQLATLAEAECVMAAIVGAAGLPSTLSAARCRRSSRAAGTGKSHCARCRWAAASRHPRAPPASAAGPT